MRKKNIFLISNMYPNEASPHYGIFVKNFSDMLSQTESYDISAKAVIRGKKNNLIGKIISYFFFTIEILTKGILKKYDIIYVHYFKYSVLPTYLLKLLFNNKKLIYNFHGSDLIRDNEDSVKLSKIKVKALRVAEGVVVPSLYYKKLILAYIDLPEDKLFVSPSGGIDNQVFYPNKHFEFQSQLILGYVGRLDIGKGVEVYIKSLLLLKNKGIPYNAYIIGSGSLEKEFKDMVKNFGLEGLVEFILPQRQSKLREYYTHFDLLIFPTYRMSESLGLVGLEALSCGTPVIGSRIGEIQNYIHEEKNGFLFEQRNEEELYHQIIKYYKLSIDDKQKMREYCALSVQHFSKNTVIKEMTKFLNNIL